MCLMGSIRILFYCYEFYENSLTSVFVAASSRVLISRNRIPESQTFSNSNKSRTLDDMVSHRSTRICNWLYGSYPKVMLFS